MKALGRLDLENELFFHDHVEDLRREWFSSVINHHRHLTVNAVPLSHQVSLHGKGVNVLAESKAESSMNAVEHSND